MQLRRERKRQDYGAGVIFSREIVISSGTLRYIKLLALSVLIPLFSALAIAQPSFPMEQVLPTVVVIKVDNIPKGTGFLINPEGYILTNAHVVCHGAQATVLLRTGDEKPASVEKLAPERDLALLKIEGQNLPYARLGDASRLKIQDEIFVVGFPDPGTLGTQNPSVVRGQVTALGQHLEHFDGCGGSIPLDHLIQTNASGVSHGSSGGPMFDSQGEVIGIVNGGIRDTRGSLMGIAFAIPVRDALQEFLPPTVVPSSPPQITSLQFPNEFFQGQTVAGRIDFWDVNRHLAFAFIEVEELEGLTSTRVSVQSCCPQVVGQLSGEIPFQMEVPVKSGIPEELTLRVTLLDLAGNQSVPWKQRFRARVPRPQIVEVDFPKDIAADGEPNLGTVKFRAPNADLEEARFDRVAGPFEPFRLDLREKGLFGKAEGVIDFAIRLHEVGPVTIRVTLMDAKGLRSEPKEFSIVAQPPNSQALTPPATPPSSKKPLLTEVRDLFNTPIMRWVLLLSLASLVIGIVWLSYSRRARTPTSGDIQKQRKSIAVLPFMNISAESENEYFSDGMTEELINKLSKVEELQVAARTSAFMFKGKNEDVRKIGKQLDVSAVVEGSVRQASDKLRVTARLVNAADGYELWSETYERELKDVFAIQEEISQAIVTALKIKLVGAQKASLVKRYTEDLEAYQLYLKGRYFWNKRTAENVTKAIACFHQAIEVDPHYALAYAGLADCYGVLGFYSLLPPNETIPKSMEAARKAVELDDTLVEVHVSRAFAGFCYNWDWSNAEREFKRTIKLNPKYATAHHWYALILMATGRTAESLSEMRQALELEPFSLVINTTLGWLLYFAREYDQAIEQLRKTLKLDPNFVLARLRLGQTYVQKSLFKEAIAELQEALALSSNSVLIKAALGHAYAMWGKTGGAKKTLEELKQLSQQRYVPADYVAAIYTALDEKDMAFDWLERASEEHAAELVSININPVFDSLRTDPRFTAFLTKLGLENRSQPSAEDERKQR